MLDRERRLGGAGADRMKTSGEKVGPVEGAKYQSTQLSSSRRN